MSTVNTNSPGTNRNQTPRRGLHRRLRPSLRRWQHTARRIIESAAGPRAAGFEAASPGRGSDPAPAQRVCSPLVPCKSPRRLRAECSTRFWKCLFTGHKGICKCYETLIWLLEREYWTLIFVLATWVARDAHLGIFNTDLERSGDLLGLVLFGEGVFSAKFLLKTFFNK